jgi:DnaJ-class molecular chaperone
MKNDDLVSEEDCKECSGKGFIREDVTLYDETISVEGDCAECEGEGVVRIYADDNELLEYAQKSVDFVFAQVFGAK